MKCGDCKYSTEFFPAEGDDPGRHLCGYPIPLLPLSMQGTANREREPVDPERTDCPTWTAR